MGGFRLAWRCAATALTACGLSIWPSTAAAQDAAIELEFRQSTFQGLLEPPEFEDGTTETAPRVTRPAERVFVFGDRFGSPRTAQDLREAGVPETCDADGNSEIQLRRATVRGDLGVNSQSNAAQTDGGDSDIVTTIRGEATLLRQSRWGICSRMDGKVVFSPDWDFTTSFSALANDSIDEIAGDDSSVALNFAYTHRLGHDTTTDGAFRTRASLSLENGAGYGDFFDDWTVTTHNLRVGVSHLVTSEGGRTTSVGGGIGRTFANPERVSYNYVSLDANHQAKNIWGNWTLRLNGSASYREYDEVSPQRQDYIYSLGATISHKIGSSTEIIVGLNARVRDSNVDTRDYESINLPITLRRSF